MNKNVYLAGLIMFISSVLSAQDEGTIVKRERIDRSKSIFFGFGPSVTLGKNIGDYNVGFNLEAGFSKRINRILSVGPSLSFVKFKYDPEVTNVGNKNTFIGGPFVDDDGFTYYEGLYFDLKGGDISLTSLAVNIKLNVIPVRDNSKFSFYGFVKPFIANASRSEVNGPATYLINYGDISDASDWQEVDEFQWTASSPYVKSEYGIDVSQDLKKESKITGGLFVGPGIELFPAKAFSGFLQVAVGYTFPISYVSTGYYYTEGNENNLQTFITSGNIEKYPMLEKGFPSLSIQFGASYNF